MKRIRKRVFVCVLVVLMALAVPGVALADTGDELADGSILQPMYTYLSTVRCNLDISSSGVASMSSSLSCSSYIDNVKLYNYLQRYQNGAWTTVNSWTKSENDNSSSWSKTYSVSSGYNYRLLTYFYSYRGTTQMEYTSRVSDSLYY